MMNGMTRRESRELAFILLFEKSFTEDSIEEILRNAEDAREVSGDEFALALAQGATEHVNEIDALISECSHKWSKTRLSRVALSIMRLAVYEMRWQEDIPVSVSINEAVELAKQYGGEADASFVNGVLGGISRLGNTENA